MKISSKLLLSSFLPLATAAVVLLVISSSMRLEREAERKSATALTVFRSVFDLDHRVDYYLLYRSDRTVKEWYTLHDSLDALVSNAVFHNHEQDALLVNIRENVREMKALFSALISVQQNPQRVSRDMSSEIESRVTSNILVRKRYLSSDALRLYELCSRDRNDLVWRTHLLSLGLILLSALVMVVTLLPMNRKIVVAIRRLMSGAAAFGSGDLSHRIGLRSTDEIGELAQAFDRMAEYLQSITVSRDELTREMEERRQAELALRASEMKFRWLYEAGFVAMAFWNSDGIITEGNQAFCRLIGVEPEELPARKISWNTITPPELILRDRAASEQMAAWGFCEPYEKELFHRDGRRVPVIIAGAFMAGSQSNGISLAIDLTERKRMEEALRSSEATLKMAIQSTGIGTFDYRPLPSTFIWSEMTKQHFGLLPDEPVDYQVFLSGLHPDDRERVDTLLREACAAKNQGVLDVECRTVGIHDGRERWIIMRGQVLIDERDGPVRLLGTTLDITERKRGEDSLRQTMAELERSNTELEQFAYVASHDLQEPLRMVASFVQLLAKKYRGRLDDKADQYIHYAVEGALRMQKLIEGLLAYSRISRGVPFRFVNMNTVFAEAVGNLAAAIRENDAVVTRGFLPVALGDEVQLLQLFQNLIGNALKYRHPDRAPTIHVTAQRQGMEWEFCFRDNGIGIDREYYDRVFLIFQRLHRRDQYPGTGIGLALCKRIVERHGGRIWIESVAGEGTQFYFTIPLVGGKVPNLGEDPNG